MSRLTLWFDLYKLLIFSDLWIKKEKRLPHVFWLHFLYKWGFNSRSSHTKNSKNSTLPLGVTLSIIRYVSRVKWSNQGKGVAPFPTPRCFTYFKGSLRVRSLTLFITYLYIKTVYIYIYVCVCVCVYYIVRVLVVTKSLCGYASSQVQYNMERAQYLG